jgi:hypothetical protein
VDTLERSALEVRLFFRWRKKTRMSLLRPTVGEYRPLGLVAFSGTLPAVAPVAEHLKVIQIRLRAEAVYVVHLVSWSTT